MERSIVQREAGRWSPSRRVQSLYAPIRLSCSPLILGWRRSLVADGEPRVDPTPISERARLLRAC